MVYKESVIVILITLALRLFGRRFFPLHWEQNYLIRYISACLLNMNALRLIDLPSFLLMFIHLELRHWLLKLGCKVSLSTHLIGNYCVRLDLWWEHCWGELLLL